MEAFGDDVRRIGNADEHHVEEVVKADGKRQFVHPILGLAATLRMRVAPVGDPDDEHIDGEEDGRCELRVYAEHVVKRMIEERKLNCAAPKRECASEKDGEKFAAELFPIVDFVDEQLARQVHNPDKRARERCMKVILKANFSLQYFFKVGKKTNRIPRHPIHAIFDVRIGVVPTLKILGIALSYCRNIKTFHIF